MTGCKACEDEPAPTSEVAPPPIPATPSAAVGPEVRSDDYVLSAHADEAYPAGEAQSFSIELEGRGKWHVNTDYPISVEVEADAPIVLEQGRFSKADAAKFQAEGARFDVPFKATGPGEVDVMAIVDFAVCSEDNCLPATEKLKVALRIES